MKAVGIIANPASGKDIRRLVANGTLVTNQEKIDRPYGPGAKVGRLYGGWQSY